MRKQASVLIDGLKTVASQLIVLHHLIAYGPLPGVLRTVAPGPVDWLYDYGRMAVQVFLVIGGFLAARTLAASLATPGASLARLVAGRYLRLALPFLAAMLVAIAAAAWARPWLDADFVPAAPTWAQWWAHVALLHGVLGFPSLSAGVWYVAIDFQLFVLLALLCRAGGVWPDGAPASGARATATGRADGTSAGTRGPRPSGRTIVLVALCAAASLFLFNRAPDLDNWAIYFFAAYGMGALVQWAGNGRRLAATVAAIGAVVVLALIVDFRTRILLAFATAAALAWSTARPRAAGRLGPVLRAFSDSSYALFLIHFPVCMAVVALYVRSGANGPGAALGALVLAWLASNLAGFAFHRWVEQPALGRFAIGATRRVPG